MITITKSYAGTGLVAEPDSWRHENVGGFTFTATFVPIREPYGNELNALDALLEMLGELQREAQARRNKLALRHAAELVLNEIGECLDLTIDLGNMTPEHHDQCIEHLANTINSARLS